MSQAFNSSAVAARPVPNFWAKAQIARTRSSTIELRIRHAPVRRHVTGFENVAVIKGVRATGPHQLITRRLLITGVIPASRHQVGFFAVPCPRQPEPSESLAVDRLLQ